MYNGMATDSVEFVIDGHAMQSFPHPNNGTADTSQESVAHVPGERKAHDTDDTRHSQAVS